VQNSDHRTNSCRSGQKHKRSPLARPGNQGAQLKEEGETRKVENGGRAFWAAGDRIREEQDGVKAKLDRLLARIGSRLTILPTGRLPPRHLVSFRLVFPDMGRRCSPL